MTNQDVRPESTPVADKRTASEAKTLRIPKYKLRVEMDPNDDDEALREYAYGLVMTAFQFYQKEGRIHEALLDQLAPPWNRYEWNVPNKQRSDQVKECVSSFRARELRAAISMALETSLNSAAGSVSIDSHDPSQDNSISLRFNPSLVLLTHIDVADTLFLLLVHPRGRGQLAEIVRLTNGTRPSEEDEDETPATGEKSEKQGTLMSPARLTRILMWVTCAWIGFLVSGCRLSLNLPPLASLPLSFVAGILVCLTSSREEKGMSTKPGTMGQILKLALPWLVNTVLASLLMLSVIGIAVDCGLPGFASLLLGTASFVFLSATSNAAWRWALRD